LAKKKAYLAKKKLEAVVLAKKRLTLPKKIGGSSLAKKTYLSRKKLEAVV